MNKVFVWLALQVCVISIYGSSQKASSSDSRYALSISVIDKYDKEGLVMASYSLTPLGATGFTSVDGTATISNIPQGEYDLEVKYIGYETYRRKILVDKNMRLQLSLAPTSLRLQEVEVTARQNASGSSTSSIIGRQAIDHLQAVSLADILQLVPGQRMGNTDLTSQTNLQLRTLSNNTNQAFGSSIIVDGVPISNNGSLSQGGFSNTAFVGTDLRQLAADNIESVEVVRGIPSAEYGDLSSGLVVVHSMYGITPWKVRAKVNPSTQNYSISRGVGLAEAGILNVSGDYAQAWGDPRMKTRSYHRYNVSVGHSYAISSMWHADTRLRLMRMKDWSGKDPDAIADGTEAKTKNFTLSLSHNGRISANKKFMRTLSYTLGLSVSDLYSRNTSYVSSSTGLVPVITARETGYFNVPWHSSSYLATGVMESRPSNVYAKVNNTFYVRSGAVRQNFKMGVDYRYDWNNGKGYYNVDDNFPYRSNNNGRPRPFSDIPGAHLLGAFAENHLVWDMNKVNTLRAQVGVRLTSIQPFSSLQAWSVSPRLNLSLSLTQWLLLRGGVGLSSKTPSLDYLYPDKRYDDRVAANYMTQSDQAAQILNYHTQVLSVEKSKSLKNATTTKYELGVDFRLRNGKKLSIVAYRDKTPNGFNSLNEYVTYESKVFTPTSGLIINSGLPTVIDYDAPERRDIVFMSAGTIGNTNVSLNRGVEFDMDFGEIRPIHTSVYLSGAYSETKMWDTNLNASSVRTALLPTSYTSYGLTPFKVVYPGGLNYSRYRQFITTLRLVTAIPTLSMVASFTTQAIFHNSSLSYGKGADAIGWIDTGLNYHSIADNMREGYIGMDGVYYEQIPSGIESVAIKDLAVNGLSNVPIKSPVTWNMAARLTKELGDLAGLSLYVNNMLFYEPFLKGNNTSSLVQRNTGTFQYGVELYINL